MKLVSDKSIVIATSNKNKMLEYQKIFKGFNLLSLDDIGFIDEIEENGKTFKENSYIKADKVYQYVKHKNLNHYILADDSGLVIESLHGQPGIYSARFSGANATYQSNRDLVLKKLENRHFKFQRIAYLTTYITFITPTGKVFKSNGKAWGRITKKEIGDKTFGYNCIFYSFKLHKTFGEMDKADLRVNHRYIASLKILKLFKKSK